jgi:hypothetical protein
MRQLRNRATTRTWVVGLLALAAIPFWSAVGYLVPRVATRLAPQPVAETAPLPLPMPRRLSPPCLERMEERRQSLVDCVFRIGPARPSLMQPGDYPLRGLRGIVAGVSPPYRAL